MFSILEHWYNVFRGLEPWDQTTFFYPWPETLGYNNGYLLSGAIHAVFRSLGLDVFLAGELSSVVIRGAGFIGFYLFAVEAAALSFPWALVGAALFTLANNMYFQASHPQLLTVSFAPLLGWLMYRAWRALRASTGSGDAGSGDAGRAALFAAVGWGCAAALLYGAWLFTEFYMAWFTAFFGALFIAALVIETAVRRDWRALAPLRRWPVAVILLAFLLCAAPFLRFYLPKATETGTHPFAAVMGYWPSILDFLHIGSRNYLFGWLDTWWTHLLRPGFPDISERTIGFPPVLALLLVWAMAAALLRGGRFDRALAIATGLCFVLVVHVGQFTLWYWVFKLVPGASALRAIARFALLLEAPVVLLVIRLLQAKTRRWPALATCAVVVLLVGEELQGFTYAFLDRPADRRFLASIPRPPEACRLFFVQNATQARRIGDPLSQTTYPHNVEAMLVSETLRIPTINGYSTFNPPDWRFDSPERADYLLRVGRYLESHALTDGVCRLDPAARTWSVVNVADLPVPAVPFGETIALNQPKAEDYLWKGWSHQEVEGRWTEGPVTTLFFAPPVNLAADRKVVFVVSARPFAPGGQSSPVTVEVNGRVIATWHPGPGWQELSATAPADLVKGRPLELGLRIAHPRSPAEVGESMDSRKLGLLVRWFRIDQGD